MRLSTLERYTIWPEPRERITGSTAWVTRSAEGVELEQAFHLVQRHRFHRGGQCLAGVGDQHVDLACCGDRGVDEGLVGDVQPQPRAGSEVAEGFDVAGRGDDVVTPGQF